MPPAFLAEMLEARERDRGGARGKPGRAARLDAEFDERYRRDCWTRSPRRSLDCEQLSRGRRGAGEPAPQIRASVERGEVRPRACSATSTPNDEETPDVRLANLKKIKTLKELAPEGMAAFVAFDAAAMKDGAIPREVQGTDGAGGGVHDAVPVLHRDPREGREGGRVHRRRDRRGGLVAAALRAGGAITHATHAIG